MKNYYLDFNENTLFIKNESPILKHSSDITITLQSKNFYKVLVPKTNNGEYYIEFKNSEIYNIYKGLFNASNSGINEINLDTNEKHQLDLIFNSYVELIPNSDVNKFDYIILDNVCIITIPLNDSKIKKAYTFKIKDNEKVSDYRIMQPGKTLVTKFIGNNVTIDYNVTDVRLDFLVSEDICKIECTSITPSTEITELKGLTHYVLHGLPVNNGTSDITYTLLFTATTLNNTQVFLKITITLKKNPFKVVNMAVKSGYSDHTLLDDNYTWNPINTPCQMKIKATDPSHNKLGVILTDGHSVIEWKETQHGTCYEGKVDLINIDQRPNCTISHITLPTAFNETEFLITIN